MLANKYRERRKEIAARPGKCFYDGYTCACVSTGQKKPPKRHRGRRDENKVP